MARATSPAIPTSRHSRSTRVGAALLALAIGCAELGPCMAADAAMLNLSMPWGGTAVKGQDRRMHASLNLGDMQSSLQPITSVDEFRRDRMISLDLTNLRDLYVAAEQQGMTQGNNMSAGGKVMVGLGIAAAVFAGAYVFVISNYDDAAKDSFDDDKKK